MRQDGIDQGYSLSQQQEFQYHLNMMIRPFHSHGYDYSFIRNKRISKRHMKRFFFHSAAFWQKLLE